MGDAVELASSSRLAGSEQCDDTIAMESLLAFKIKPPEWLARIVLDLLPVRIIAIAIIYWQPGAPLLKQEWDASGLALIAQRPDPVRV